VYGSYNPDESSGLGAGTKSKGDSTKRKAAPVELPDFDWQRLYNEGTIAKLKVPDLKAYCGANGLSCKGKKAELVERVEEHLSNAASQGTAKKAKAEPQDDAMEMASTAPVSVEGNPELKVKSECMDAEDKSPGLNQVKVVDDVKQEEDAVDLVNLLEDVTDQRPMCRYGAGCYRKNPEHFKEFRHPS